MHTKSSRFSSILKCLAITGAFWVLMLFGPLLVMLFNKITTWFTGGGFYEGSFGYEILVFFAQPLACYLAHSTAETISDSEHSICVLVNEIVSACILVILALVAFFLSSEITNGINHLVSSAIVIACSVQTARVISNPNQNGIT